jgi:hypothetical protein
MKLSVWNNATRRYDYYQSSGDTGIHAGAPPRANSFELGATPEQAAWPLPPGAVKVGSGDLPEGRIASREAGQGFKFDLPSSIVYAAIGYVLWRMIK